MSLAWVGSPAGCVRGSPRTEPLRCAVQEAVKALATDADAAVTPSEEAAEPEPEAEEEVAEEEPEVVEEKREIKVGVWAQEETRGVGLACGRGGKRPVRRGW